MDRSMSLSEGLTGVISSGVVGVGNYSLAKCCIIFDCRGLGTMKHPLEVVSLDVRLFVHPLDLTMAWL